MVENPVGAKTDIAGSDVLSAILELKPPWKISAAEVDIDARRVAVDVDFERGGRFTCAKCGQGGAPVHDAAHGVWRLRDGLAGWVTEIRGRVPRVRCPSCRRVRMVRVPWKSISGRVRGKEKNG